MGYKAQKTEYTGAKHGSGAYWGVKQDVKKESKNIPLFILFFWLVAFGIVVYSGPQEGIREALSALMISLSPWVLIGSLIVHMVKAFKRRDWLSVLGGVFIAIALIVVAIFALSAVHTNTPYLNLNTQHY